MVSPFERSVRDALLREGDLRACDCLREVLPLRWPPSFGLGWLEAEFPIVAHSSKLLHCQKEGRLKSASRVIDHFADLSSAVSCRNIRPVPANLSHPLLQHTISIHKYKVTTTTVLGSHMAKIPLSFSRCILL